MTGDVERLAEVLIDAAWDDGPHPTSMEATNWAIAVLASDWLAAHDAEVAARALRRGRAEGASAMREALADESRDAIENELRDLWHRALEREGNLASAVADVLWKATQYGETEDGDTYAYIVPKGCMHRLIGVAQSNGAHVPVAFRARADRVAGHGEEADQ